MIKSATESDTGRVYCIECGRELFLSDGSKKRKTASMGTGIKAYTSKYSQTKCLPWCKDCLARHYETLITTYGDNTVALFYWCRINDLPFYAELMPKDKTAPSEILDGYLSALRLNKNDAVMKGFVGGAICRERDIPVFVEAEVVTNPITEYKDTDYEDLYIKWGRNRRYDTDDIADLERIYNNIASQQGIITDQQTGQVVDKVTEMAIIEAACNLLESRKARVRGDSEASKRFYELYDKAMAGQLLRGRDVKDKQVGAALVQDIVKYCEADDFIEPWDQQINYPHRKDVVDQIFLHILNYVGHLCSDIFNIHVPKLKKVPDEYKLDGRNDNFAKEDTEVDTQFKKSLKDIQDFKASQHFSDDDLMDDDSADTDADTDTDESLFGTEGE